MKLEQYAERCTEYDIYVVESEIAMLEERLENAWQAWQNAKSECVKTLCRTNSDTENTAFFRYRRCNNELERYIKFHYPDYNPKFI